MNPRHVALDTDLKKLNALAFDRAEWAEDVLGQYHALLPKLSRETAQQLDPLYRWMFVPTTLWPFNIQELLADCLVLLERGKRLTSRHRLLIELLPEPPNDTICAAVAGHEHNVHKGVYENLLRTQAKYAQSELALRNSPELRHQWNRIKAAFDVQTYQDHKGVIRRTMGAERNLRTLFTVNLRRKEDAFRATFDAFCLRWNLYGMQHDEPLLLKLAVNLTPYGTLIHIPAYWSFDPKRDIKWDAIAKLHRTRVPGRQGAALAEGLARRMRDAVELKRLDREARCRGLHGDKKHEFLCTGLGWDPRTSAKRLARLRTEFTTK